MTEYHKKQAIIRYELDGQICQVCRKRATQLAHRIPRTKVNLKKYGENIINHNINLVPVCDLKCNTKIDIGNKEYFHMLLINIIASYYYTDLRFFQIEEMLEKFGLGKNG